MIEQMTIFYHETQGDSMDETQGFPSVPEWEIYVISA